MARVDTLYSGRVERGEDSSVRARAALLWACLLYDVKTAQREFERGRLCCLCLFYGASGAHAESVRGLCSRLCLLHGVNNAQRGYSSLM